MIQLRPMDVSDFPVGCVVIPADDFRALQLGVSPQTEGVVVAHSGPLFIVVWWEGKRRPGIIESCLPHYCHKVSDNTPAGTHEDQNGRLVISANGHPIAAPVATDYESAPVPDLKRMNTDGRTRCAGCGAELKDPGMGPSFRHCPVCEP
jgi:hypothetical protein